MKDMRAELGLWVGRIETILIDRGVLDEKGQLALGMGPSFPQEIEEVLDGFIDNPIELIGPLSPAGLMAAHLMAKEVLNVLQRSEFDR